MVSGESTNCAQRCLACGVRFFAMRLGVQDIVNIITINILTNGKRWTVRAGGSQGRASKRWRVLAEARAKTYKSHVTSFGRAASDVAHRAVAKSSSCGGRRHELRDLDPDNRLSGDPATQRPGEALHGVRSAAGADDLDHADVVAAPELSADDGAIKIRVPIDLFLVSRDQVMAAPNTTPAGATTPAARVALDCRLVTDGAKFSLQDFSSDPAGTPLPPDLQLPVSIDLGGRLAQLNLPKPGSSRADLVGDVVAIRFDPVGGPVERLFASQQWGLFLDGPTVESLATAAIPVDRLKSVVPSATASGHWNPRGDVPHVDIEVRGKMAVPNPFKVEITLSAPTDLFGRASGYSSIRCPLVGSRRPRRVRSGLFRDEGRGIRRGRDEIHRSLEARRQATAHSSSTSPCCLSSSAAPA